MTWSEKFDGLVIKQRLKMILSRADTEGHLTEDENQS